MNANEYECEGCHRVLEKTWTDQQAMEEATANGFADEDLAIVCDDCYRQIMGLPPLH